MVSIITLVGRIHFIFVLKGVLLYFFFTLYERGSEIHPASFIIIIFISRLAKEGRKHRSKLLQHHHNAKSRVINWHYDVIDPSTLLVKLLVLHGLNSLINNIWWISLWLVSIW